ncbi:MAG: hypothetical protein KGZ83_08230 [Sulfuricella sp.]|nr:hypothetical protein [Sulfuricella sp.]
MDEYLTRQALLMLRQIGEYRANAFTLNSLIQRLEGLLDAVDRELWRDAIFPLIFSLEQINASVLDEQRQLTSNDNALINGLLQDLEKIITNLVALEGKRRSYGFAQG